MCWINTHQLGDGAGMIHDPHTHTHTHALMHTHAYSCMERVRRCTHTDNTLTLSNPRTHTHHNT